MRCEDRNAVYKKPMNNYQKKKKSLIIAISEFCFAFSLDTTSTSLLETRKFQKYTKIKSSEYSKNKF